MRGFTLLEVLIAVSILVIITGIVYSTFSSTITGVEIAREQSISNQTARIILDQMSKEFESAYLAQDSGKQDVSLGMVGIDREINGRPADTIHFTTLSGTSPGQNNIETDLCEVGYSLEAKEEELSTDLDEEAKQRLALFRREDVLIDDSIIDGGAVYQMADNIAELNITYKDIDGNEFEAWDTVDGEQKGMLPGVITIRLVIMEKSGKENVYTTAVHPMLVSSHK
ncbi:MAG: prepilin-type N-terminal cleavage/methylation domain-containing protein [Deltaproteobacteria bacterium]|nr:prepilin-type N-terminal cleavage/methylation domain-containing protein [Deltaproteobacteria bacterium]